MIKTGVFKNLRTKFKGAVRPQKTTEVEKLLDFLGVGDVKPSKLSEATYFTCLKILSESIGKLPLKLMRATNDGGVVEERRHPLYNVLRYQPNPYMTSSTFWSTIEYNRNHYGNAYALIDGAGSSTKLWVLPSNQVEVWYDDAQIISKAGGIWYLVSCKEGLLKFSHEEILHFKTSTSFDGIKGLAVCDILKTTLDGNLKAQTMLNSLYDNGFTGKIVMQYTSDLSDENVKAFRRNIARYAKGDIDGDKTTIPIPVGVQLQPLNAKLTDAEFLGIKKYSALQIAAACGIKPNQINDYEKASYASAEAQQLAFYVDTLLYILKQIEEELAGKLLSEKERAQGLFFKFNIDVILRADLKTKIETLCSAVGNFIYTPNEARALLDKPAKPGGERLIGNGSTIPIDLVGSQYNKKGGDAGGS